jgi:hypothetical protein
MDAHELDDEHETRPDLPIFAAALRTRAWADHDTPTRPALPVVEDDDVDAVPTARVPDVARFERALAELRPNG